MNSISVNPADLVPTSSVAKPAPRRRSKLKWYILGGLGVVAVLIWLSIAKKRAQAGLIPITTEAAAVRTIVQTVTATGKVQPEIEVKISPEVYGEITALPFREGATVHKGDLIVRIKPDLYQAQVDQQTAALASSRSVAIDSRAKLAKAEADFGKWKDLYARNLVSDSDFLSYKTAFDVATADYDAARSNVDQAAGFLKQSKDQLSKTVIYSPMDGTVSSRSSEVGERVVATSEFAGTEIMRVADLSTMEVRVKVNENDVVNVKVGDVAKISIDAYPDRKFTGQVKEIASSADNAGASGGGAAGQASGAVSDEVTNFIVKIRISDKGISLRPGMSATAEIETQSVHDVISVPIQSVTVRDRKGLTSDEVAKEKEKEAKERSGNDLNVESEREDAIKGRDSLQRIVFVRNGDIVHSVQVETGIADEAYIELKSGIKAGDQVVSGGYAAISQKLKDGSKIRIEAPTPVAEAK